MFDNHTLDKRTEQKLTSAQEIEVVVVAQEYVVVNRDGRR